MRLREIYSSYLMVGGLVCFVLGVGNWTVGAIEAAKYQALLRKTAQTGLEETYRSFQELDQQKNTEVLRRINDDREKFNAARVKLNFFYVVLAGGRLLFGVGLVLVVVEMVRLIRRDARRRVKQIVDLSGTLQVKR